MFGQNTFGSNTSSALAFGASTGFGGASTASAFGKPATTQATGIHETFGTDEIYWYIYSCGYHGELEYAKIYHDPGGLGRQGRWYIVNVGQPTRSKVNILRLGGRGLWGGSSLKIFTELRVGRPTFLHMNRIHDSCVSIWYLYLRLKTESHPCKSVNF